MICNGFVISLMCSPSDSRMPVNTERQPTIRVQGQKIRTYYAHVEETVRHGQCHHGHVVVHLNIAPSSVPFPTVDLEGDKQHDQDISRYRHSIETAAVGLAGENVSCMLPKALFSGRDKTWVG